MRGAVLPPLQTGRSLPNRVSAATISTLNQRPGRRRARPHRFNIATSASAAAATSFQVGRVRTDAARRIRDEYVDRMHVTPFELVGRSAVFLAARSSTGDGSARQRFQTGDELQRADRSARSFRAPQRLLTVVPIVGRRRREVVGSIEHGRHDGCFVVGAGERRPHARPQLRMC